jgi:hypothetical protein
MDAPQPPHMTAAAWLALGLFVSAVWIAGSIFFDGSGIVGLIGAPIFVLLYVAAIIVVDRWVSSGDGFFQGLHSQKPK